MFNFNSRTLSLLNFLINCYNILIVVFINKNLGYILYYVSQKFLLCSKKIKNKKIIKNQNFMLLRKRYCRWVCTARYESAGVDW